MGGNSIRRFFFYCVSGFWALAGCRGFAVAEKFSTLYGHQAYQQVMESRLRPVGKYRSTGRFVQLLPKAALAFQDMQKAAYSDGVKIVAISDFRSFSYQQGLFQSAVKRYGDEDRAARWVAPPGFSEHHTGLALDLGDQDHRECDNEPCFEKTPAYMWLTENARRFGYELSFPRNRTKISFEPWHWRFIGDKESKGIFHIE